jgi:hypothetical protein
MLSGDRTGIQISKAGLLLLGVRHKLVGECDGTKLVEENCFNMHLGVLLSKWRYEITAIDACFDACLERGEINYIHQWLVKY